MRKALWFLVGALFVALVAPVAHASSYTYSFTGTCYFAGTSVSFTTNGPAVMNTDYTPNSGATDLFTGGTDYNSCPPPVPVSDQGSIEYLYFAPSPYVFSPCTSVCTLQLYIVSTDDSASGPTLTGLTIPGPGTYSDYFGNGGTLTVTEAVTPEPSSVALLLCPLVLLGFVYAARKRTPGVLAQLG
jgi:hypothetical protein